MGWVCSFWGILHLKSSGGRLEKKPTTLFSDTPNTFLRTFRPKIHDYLGHFGLVYIRMLGHLQMSAHLLNFDRLWNGPFIAWVKESRATLAGLYRTSGRFSMLQLISVDSRHFAQPELSLRWSDQAFQNQLGEDSVASVPGSTIIHIMT